MFNRVTLLCLCFFGPTHAEDRPNFIFFITDDISWNDLGCSGNTTIKTPNIDQMAKEGMMFTNAYLTTSSCSPSRCSIITSRYPHNTGAPELHTSLPAGQALFPKLLKDAGYYTVLSGKHHMGKNANPAFVKVSRGKGPGKEEDWVPLLQQRPKDQPFFAWFASTDAHRGWSINNNATVYDPMDVIVPPYLIDGPQTRKDLADYYHEVSRTDFYLGKLREELKAQEIDNNTYIIYCSDNGRPFPRCKTRLYDSGIKTPFIVACPGKIQPAVTDSLISAIDIGSTVLELAGVAKDPRMQGVSFTSVLKEPTSKTRDFAFAEHNWHVYQAHERMVRTGDWLYIRNAWPDRQNLCVESVRRFPAGKELWEAHDNNRLNKNQRDIFLVPRPAEELFNVKTDPYQLNNLIGMASVGDLKALRNTLDRWARETGDTVPANPTNDREDANSKKLKGHKRGTMPGAEMGAEMINRPGPVLTVREAE